MALPPDATLGDAGEFGLISELLEIFDGDDHVLVGPGDDAAVLRIKHGHVVVSTDLMVEGRHFRRDWASASDVGHRAAARCPTSDALAQSRRKWRPSTIRSVETTT